MRVPGARRPSLLASKAAYVAVGVAAAPRWVRHLEQPDMWTDEHFSLRFSAPGARWTDDPNNPPLYWAALRGWRRLTRSDDLAGMRGFSVVCSLAAAAAWIPRFRRLAATTGRPGLALAAWSVLVAGPHALLYGRFARAFGFCALLVATGVTGAERAAASGSVAPLIVSGSASYLTGLTQYFVFAGLSAVQLLQAAWAGPKALARQTAVTAAATVATTATLARAGQGQPAPGAERSQLLAAGRLLRSVGLGAGYPAWSTGGGENVSAGSLPLAGAAAVTWTAALTAAAATSAACRSRGDRDPAAVQALAVLGLSVATAHASGVENHRFQMPKLVFPFLGLFAIGAAQGLDRLARRRPAGAALGVAVLAAAAASGRRLLARNEGFLYAPFGVPWRETAATIADLVGAEDAVFTADGPLLYYLDRIGAPARVHATPDLGGDQAAQDTAISGRHHEVVVVVRRATVTAPNAARLDEVEGALDAAGYRVRSPISVGMESAFLNRIRRLAAGADTGPHRVVLHVYDAREAA